MGVRFPRRIDKQLRPAYGLTVRQVVLLGTGAFGGALIVIAGQAAEVPLAVRAVVALGLVGLSALLAFVRIEGRPLEKWLLLKLRFWSGARKRAWRKGAPKRVVIPQEPVISTAQPAAATARPAEAEEAAVVIVAIEAVLMLALALLTLYLSRGGLEEIRQWLRYVFQ